MHHYPNAVQLSDSIHSIPLPSPLVTHISLTSLLWLLFLHLLPTLSHLLHARSLLQQITPLEILIRVHNRL
jgi:hypothetical protein